MADDRSDSPASPDEDPAAPALSAPAGQAAEVRLLLSDVDGTLLDRSKQVPQSAVEAVRRLRAHGVAFAVTSSRPARGMLFLRDLLELDTPLSAFNGGVVLGVPDLRPLEVLALPDDVASGVIRIMEEDGLSVWLYAGPEDWCVRDPQGPHVPHEEHAVRFAPKVVSDFAPEIPKGAVKIVGVSDDHPKVEACEARVLAAFGARVSASRSQAHYLDVTHPQATKGHVVHALSRRLGIPRAAIATIGDGFNDVAMFRESGLAIAMGNAPEPVRRAAGCVAGENDALGYARALERFVLPRAPRRPERPARG